MKNLFRRMVILTLFGFLCFEFTGAKELALMKTNAKIMMIGRLSRPATTGVNSAPVTSDDDPIVVNQNSNNIEIVFKVTYGAVSIRVIGKSGLPVITTNVNAEAGTTCTINTQNLSAGTYTLKISDTRGGSVTGEFSIP